MLETNHSKALLGLGAAAVTAGAFYLLRRHAHRAETLDDMGDDELADFADDSIILEVEVDEPFTVDAELVDTERFDTEAEMMEALGESWTDGLEMSSAERGPAPGQELPFADPSKLESTHHQHGTKSKF